MWLADAVAAYVERLTEREFDAPFIALLHHLGYTDVHLTHGQYEYGKDFIARKVDDGQEVHWCFQTKAGDIKSAQLRVEVQPQILLMRAGTVVHPSFDKDLPRRIVVVTTGRLVGSAGSEFDQVENYFKSLGQPTADLWDIDTLVPDLVSTLVARNGVRTQARLLEMVGRLQNMRGSRADIAGLAAAWVAPGTSAKEHWRDALTACLLASTASKAGREDLAQEAAWHLVRAYHRALERGETPNSQLLDVAHLAFDAVASEVWDQIRAAGDPVAVTSRATSAVAAFVVHPIKVARLCETLSMLALARLDAGRTEEAAELLDFIASLVQATPALTHPVGEEWTFSLLATTVALAAGDHRALARTLIEQAAIWLLDWTETGVLLPRVGASPEEVVDRMLGAPYRPTRAPGNKSMYSFAVLADLAALLGEEALMGDIVNDLDALRAMATLVVPTGVETGRRVARVEYSTTPAWASHHHSLTTEDWPVSSWFQSLEIWATFRDRHLPGVLGNAMSVQVEPPMLSTSPAART